MNPWDRSRTPGASSAGEAAAVATGMSPLGLGNDGLGSLRHPTQCCGVCALKPTLGRIPQATTVEPSDMAPIGMQLTQASGPLARRVADLRAACEVVAGPTWWDPWTVPAPLRGPEPATPIRVAIVLDPAGQGTARQVRDGVREAADAVEGAGYAVDELEPPPVDAAAKALVTMLTTPGIRAVWQHVIVERVPGSHPLIVAPIATEMPRRVGTDLDENQVAKDLMSMRMALAVNTRGLRAVALPVGIADGLPQAAQVIGPRHREDLCLDASAALEDRVGIITPIDSR